MVSVYPNPPGGHEFHGYYPIGDPMMMRTGLPGLDYMQPEANRNSATGNVNLGTGLVVPEDPNKKVRKPYTITKSRESWTEQEHDKFLEALQLFDRDWKKIEAFVGSKTVIQIRSHAQKYFLKVQKTGANEHVPPPRPKRKASHPYPQKASKNAVSQVKAAFQSSAPLVEPGLSAWTYSSVPAASMPHATKDYMVPSGSTVTQNCSSSSSESAPKIWPTNEARHQGKEKQEKPIRAMPDFAQVYSFIGSVFDPDESDHLQRLQKMEPIDVETVLMLMKNLSVNLISPEFESHRRVLSSNIASDDEHKMAALRKTPHQEGRPGNAVASV